ncbi:MAG: hypothetical protein CMB67_00210 [Euryarchaeota archaeon]|nr:hypothetical protein [Euryarchaeota archaeon]
MESWDVVVVGSGPAALRAAIACAEGGVVPLMVDEYGVGSASGVSPVAGLAASIDEMDPQSHIEDTLAAGGEESKEDVVSRVCGEGVQTLAELERWGLVVRRREGGLPHTSESPGHKVPRLTGCGDSTIREVTRTLEEQVIKRGIQRNSDAIPIGLASDNFQVRGLVTLNLLNGKIQPIQTKAVILATEGHQGLWSSHNEGAGTGSALALAAGISLSGLEWTPRHPLTTSDSSIHIPIDVLGSGGRIRRENGEDVGPEEVLHGEKCVLDLRGMDSDSVIWFSQTESRILDRLGIDISQDVIPISPGVAFTIGGAPCDDNGRVTFQGFTEEGLPAELWFSGLYAAGRSAFTGMHGQAPLAGNLLLDDLVSGKAAGNHASEWCSTANFGGSEQIKNAEQEAAAKISSFLESDGIPVGKFASKLSSAISSGQSSKTDALDAIREIKGSGIRLTDNSLVMNTEMLEAIRLDGLASIAESILTTG